MTLSDLSIKNPVFAWMLMAALIIFGAISFSRMGISQLPDVDFPVITINLSELGASPQTMETDVVDPIEGAVMQVDGVEDVVSQSLLGQATVTITFGLNRNIDAALVDVENAVVGVQKQLPKEMDPPQFSKTNPDDQPILQLALYSTDPSKASLRDLMIYIHDIATDEFASVAGVGQVRQTGYLAPELRVWPDDKKLRAYQLTVDDVINTINNEHVLLPSGLIEAPAQDLNVRTLSQADSAAAFGKIYINSRGNAANYRPITLDKVAKVEEGMADLLRISRANGKPCVGLGIVKQRGTNAVEVARAVKAKLVALNRVLPEGMRMIVVFDTTRFIEDSVNDLNKNLLLAALATALVCWVFLGSWSATFNIVLAIPTSIVGTFTILYFAGFTLNTFTLLGLSLSIGIVVDDAIMVLENIVRHQEMGKGKVRAAADGARQITFAAIATSLAIVAIFLPVAFMRGVIGKYFYQFGITMVAAVSLSLLEALTLTPMRCSEFVHVGERTTWFGKSVEAFFAASARWYAAGLRWCLDRRWWVLGGAAAFFVASLGVGGRLKKEFMPSQDQSLIFMTFKTPVGSSLEFTDSKMRQVESYLATQPDVTLYYISIGGQFGGQLNSAFSLVTLKPKGERSLDPVTHRRMSQAALMARFRKELKERVKSLDVFILDLSTRGFTSTRGTAVEVGVRGPDWDTLVDAGTKLKQAMKDSGVMVDVDTDFQSGMPEVDVVPDRERAAERGVPVANIAETVNAMIGGEQVGYYPRSGHEDYIEVRVQSDQRDQADEINNLLVRNNRGEVVPLSTVTSLRTILSLQQITRYKRQRTYTLYANVAPGHSQGEALAKMQVLADRILPKGYHLFFNQGSTIFTQSFEDLLFALLFGVAVAYMVLGSQFNSFVDPATVLVALPFSASGALLALWLWPFSPVALTLNIYSLIGILLLMGIVKKNSIMLVDFTNEVRMTKQAKVREALLEACPVRYRPILMTSVAVIAAAIPEALGRGAGSETQVPMAVVLIGGVACSTVLTLFVVPCFYSVVARFERANAHQDRLAEALKEG